APGLRAQTAAESADHAGGHRVLKAVRIADRHHQLSHADFARVAKPNGFERRGVNTKQSQGGVRGFAYNLSHEFACIRSQDPDSAGPVHHVTVGENKSVRREDETRTAATTAALAFRLNSHHARAHGFCYAGDHP